VKHDAQKATAQRQPAATQNSTHVSRLQRTPAGSFVNATPIERLVAALEAYGFDPKKNGKGWKS